MSDDTHKEDDATGGGPLPGSERTFTQDELNRIVGERATRAGEKAVKDLLSELGAESAEALKDALKSLRKIEDERLSEKEKLEKARDELAQQLAELKGETTSLASALKQERLHRLVEAEAYRLGFSDPTDAVRLLDVQALGNGDDPPSAEAVQEALKALAESKAYLLKSGKSSLPSTNAGAGGTGGGSARTKAEEEKAHLERGRGLIRHLPRRNIKSEKE